MFYMEEWTNILVRLSLNLLDITRRDLVLLFSPVVRVMIIFKPVFCRRKYIKICLDRCVFPRETFPLAFPSCNNRGREKTCHLSLLVRLQRLSHLARGTTEFHFLIIAEVCSSALLSQAFTRYALREMKSCS